MLSCFSHVQFCVILWTAACQAPLPIGFFRQEYRSGVPFPSPGDLLNPGIEPRSALQVDSLPSEPPVLWDPHIFTKMLLKFSSGYVKIKVYFNREKYHFYIFYLKGFFYVFLKQLIRNHIWTGASQVVLLVKNSPANAGDLRPGFDPWVGKIPWRREWQPIHYSCLENPHGQRSLMGYKSIGSQRFEYDWNHLACMHIWKVFWNLNSSKDLRLF